MHRTPLAIAFIVLSSAFPTIIVAQQDSAAITTLNELSTIVQSIESQHKDRILPNGISVTSFAQRARTVIANARKSPTARPPEYYKSLKNNVSRLKEALKAMPTDSSNALELIGFIARDIQIKASYVTTLGASVENKTSVTVSVFTLTKQGQARPGYTVRCSSLRYEAAREPEFPFNNPTNMATRNLQPGLYAISVTKDGKTILAPSPIVVGEFGEAEQAITIIVH